MELTIDTGNDTLDSDLREFFDSSNNENIQRVKQVLAKKGTSIESVLNVIPAGMIRVCAILSDVEGFPDFKAWVPENQKSIIDRAKEIFDKNFPDIMEDTRVAELMEREIKKSSAQKSPFSDVLNVVNSIYHESSWEISANGASPAVRVAFMGEGERKLLVTTCDWDDLVFISHAVLKILTSNMVEGQRIIDKQQITINIQPSIRNRMSKRISELEESVAKIKELSIYFQIDFDERAD